MLATVLLHIKGYKKGDSVGVVQLCHDGSPGLFSAKQEGDMILVVPRFNSVVHRYNSMLFTNNNLGNQNAYNIHPLINDRGKRSYKKEGYINGSTAVREKINVRTAA